MPKITRIRGPVAVLDFFKVGHFRRWEAAERLDQQLVDESTIRAMSTEEEIKKAIQWTEWEREENKEEVEGAK